MLRRRTSTVLAFVVSGLAACANGTGGSTASDANAPVDTSATNTAPTTPSTAATGNGSPAGDTALTPLQQFGKALFEDTSLSEPAGQSCASCHSESAAFQGNAGSRIPAIAIGARGGDVFGTRNTPTIAYSLYSPDFTFTPENEGNGPAQLGPTGGFFWDGRANFLADQASGPLLNPSEMNNTTRESVVAKVRDGHNADLARQLFGADVFANDAIAYQRIVGAIAAYEQSSRFHSFTSKFDDFLRGRVQLTAQEERGFALFRDPQKGNCINCHAGREGSHNPNDWLFTNFGFENLGVPRNAAIPANADASHFDLGLCDRTDLAGRIPAGMTREQFCGFFKTPTLRNIAVTAPYMHNGYFTNLRDVVRFYATRDTNPEQWYPRASDGTVKRFDDVPAQYAANVNTEVPLDRHAGETPRLTDTEIDDIVAFLQTLTDR